MSNAFNTLIVDAHYNHYKKCITGLINPTESPNKNIIYHLYSNGEISFQKGGLAYKERSEFTLKPKIEKCEILCLNLPIKYINGLSYAILTEDECEYYRNIMIEMSS